MASRQPERSKYRQRIGNLLKNPPQVSGSPSSEFEVKAHWAKYVCVLVSGYLEQALKEILLEHAASNSQSRIIRYVTETWPNSKNMKCDNIDEILRQFDLGWSDKFQEWISSQERKKEVNEIIAWRNNIAHGKEASTNNVTINSVSTKFKVACELIDFIESEVHT